MPTIDPDFARRQGLRGNGANLPNGVTQFLGVRFICAGSYVRAVKTPDGSAYVATCPRCGLRKRFRVGSGGTDSRFFDVSCR